MRKRPCSPRRAASRTQPDTGPEPANPPRRRRSSRRAFQKSVRSLEQGVPHVQRRVLDDVVQQTSQHVSDLGTGAEAEPEQIVAIDGEVRQAVRALLLMTQHLSKALERVEVSHG